MYNNNQNGLYPQAFGVVQNTTCEEARDALVDAMKGEDGNPVSEKELTKKFSKLIKEQLEEPQGETLEGLAPVMLQHIKNLEEELKKKNVSLKVRNFILAAIFVPGMVMVVGQVLQDLGIIQ